MRGACTQTTASSAYASAVTVAPRRVRGRPVGGTHAAAGRVSPVALRDGDIPAKPDHELKAEGGQQLVQLLIAKAAIGQHRHGHARRQHLVEPRQHRCLRTRVCRPFSVAVGTVIQTNGVLPPVPGHQMQRDGRVRVRVERGPIQRDDDLLQLGPSTDGTQCANSVPDIEAGITQQPVTCLIACLACKPCATANPVPMA